MKPILVVIAALAAGTAWYFTRDPEDPAPVYGVVESRRIETGFKVGGRVTAVLLREGAVVEQDQPLVRSAIEELLASRQGLQARLAESQVRLRLPRSRFRNQEIARRKPRQLAPSLPLSRAGPPLEELEQAQSELSAAEAETANAAATLGRTKTLAALGDISRQALAAAWKRLPFAPETSSWPEE